MTWPECTGRESGHAVSDRIRAAARAAGLDGNYLRALPKGRHDNRPRCLGRIARSGCKSQDGGSRPEYLDSMPVVNWVREGAMASYYQGQE